MHFHVGEKLFENFIDRTDKTACVSNIFKVSVLFYKSHVPDMLVQSLPLLIAQ
jgi:hypothetical protein